MKLTYNIAALSSQVQSNLERAQALNTRMARRLSSGLRINTAADDAAGLGMSERLRATVRSMSRAERNMNDGVSLMNTAEGGLSQVHQMLQRLRELAVHAANGALNTADRAAIDTEFQLIKQEMDRTSQATTFKDVHLLDGSIGATAFNRRSEDFDGAKESVRVAASGPVSFNNGLTFSMWINPDDYPNGDVFGSLARTPVGVHHGNGDGAGIYALALDTEGRIEFSVNPGSPMYKQVTEKSDPLKKGEWHHIVGVWDKSADSVRLFVNSEQVSEVSANGVSSLNSAQDQSIAGRSHSYYNQSFDGKVDEVSVWSLGLKDIDIARLYNNGGPTDLLSDAEAAALRSWHRFGDDPADSTDPTGTPIIKDQAGGPDGKPLYTEAEDLQGDIPTRHIKLHIGVGTSNHDTLRLRVDSTAPVDLGLEGAEVVTANEAKTAIGLVDEALHMVTENRAHVGATINRLHGAVKAIQTSRGNANTSLSHIRDADMAETMAKFSRSQVSQQAALSILSQANLQANLVLSLLA